MSFLFLYTNLIRVVIVVMTIVELIKHNTKKIAPGVIAIVLTFFPWLLSLIHIQINTITGFLFHTLIFMAVYLGAGYRYYDSYPLWDRSVHFLSGALFFGFGVTLAQKAPDAGFVGTLVFSFALSLALHVLWEVFEFLIDSIFHTDHQHWQKHSPVINHQPEKAIQPPGLVDTMNDTISCIFGTILACVGWWIYLA